MSLTADMLVDHMHGRPDEAELDHRTIGPDEARVRGSPLVESDGLSPGIASDRRPQESVKRSGRRQKGQRIAGLEAQLRFARFRRRLGRLRSSAASVSGVHRSLNLMLNLARASAE